MKNNIIKDTREIEMKMETMPTDIAEDTEITTDNNGSHEPSEINTMTLTDISESIEPMPIDTLPESIEPMTIDELPESIEPMPIDTLPESIEPMTIDDLPKPIEPMLLADESIANPAVAAQSISTEIATFFEKATSTATELFNKNRQIFITLGWIFLAIIGIKFVLAALGTVDDIPLVTPILKLVGLVSVVRFTWRYLIREHDRQELIKIIDRTKAEVLGNRQSAS